MYRPALLTTGLLLAGILLHATGSLAQRLPATPADPLAAAATFMSRIDAGEFARALELGTPEVRAGLPADKLSEVWAALPQQAGPCGPRGPLRLATRDGHQLVVASLTCAQAPLELRIAVGADGAIAGFFVAPAVVPKPTETAPNALYTDTEVRIGDAATALPGTLSIPSGDGKYPSVVLVHGSGPHDRDETIGPNKPFADLARALAQRGVAVLRYDKRSLVHPEEFSGKSFDLDTEVVDDAVAAVALLSDHARIDAGRIVVIGHSLGGLMAPRIAQRAPAIAGLVLLAAPARGLHDIVPEQVRYLAARDGTIDAAEQAQIDTLERERDEIRHLDPLNPPAHPLMLKLPVKYWADLRDYDPVAIARTLIQPMLILQGSRDYQVRADREFVLWKQAFDDNRRARLIEYAELSHLFQAGGDPPGPDDYLRAGHFDERVIADIAGWIEGLNGVAAGPSN